MSIGEAQFNQGLPAAPDIERMIIGHLIQFPDEQAPIAIDLLSPEDFSVIDHQTAFRRISAMVKAGETVDTKTFAERFMSLDAYPKDQIITFILGLTDGSPRIVSLEAYCEIIREKSLLRRAVLALHGGVLALTSTGATRSTFGEIQASVAAIDAETEQRNSGLETLASIIENVDGGGASRFLSTPPEEMGIPWPLESLTRATGGFRIGNTTVIAAATGGGKTTMATMCALHAARLNFGVAIFSPEMTKVEVAKKIIAQAGAIDLSRWLTGVQTTDERRKTMKAASDARELLIAIDERPDVTPAMIEAAITRLRRTQRVDLVVYDYIQLFSSGLKANGMTREQHVAHISRAFKKMCKRLGVAGIVLSQLNTQGDMRESAQIKNDCSNAVILTDKGGGNYEAALEKARFSARRRIPLFFDGATGQFFECDNREM